MNKQIFNTFASLCLIALTCATPLNGSPSMLFMGTIQFPDTLEEIPDLRIYCEGKRVRCEQAKQKQMYKIERPRYCNIHHILITKSIEYEIREKNTVSFIKLNPKQAYKFYTFQLCIKDFDPKTEQPIYAWDIKEQRLFGKNRIPDDTIIICYNPDYVDCIKGGSAIDAIQLPTVYIKPDILSLVGSESTLHEKSAELLLSSLDHDTLHSPIKQELKQDFGQKTVLALTIS